PRRVGRALHHAAVVEWPAADAVRVEARVVDVRAAVEVEGVVVGRLDLRAGVVAGGQPDQVADGRRDAGPVDVVAVELEADSGEVVDPVDRRGATRAGAALRPRLLVGWL